MLVVVKSYYDYDGGIYEALVEGWPDCRLRQQIFVVMFDELPLLLSSTILPDGGTFLISVLTD